MLIEPVFLRTPPGAGTVLIEYASRLRKCQILVKEPSRGDFIFDNLKFYVLEQIPTHNVD